MVSEHHLSERRACRLVGLSRDSYRQPRAHQARVAGTQSSAIPAEKHRLTGGIVAVQLLGVSSNPGRFRVCRPSRPSTA